MFKKILAAVLSLALVITTLSYSPDMAKASQTDAANYNWSSVDYIGNGSGVSEYDARYKFANVQGTAELVNIQTSLDAYPGIYIIMGSADFGYITINDQTTYDYTTGGSGLLMHMTAFTTMYNDVVVYTSSGSVMAEFYVYDSQADDIRDDDDQNVGTSDLEAPTGVSAYNFYATAQGYLVNFTEVDGAMYYNIYMDSSDVLTTVAGSGNYVSANAFSNYADGHLHNIYVAAVDSSGGVSKKSSSFKVRVTTQTNSSSDPTDISRIYVVTNSDATITKANKTDASLTIISGDGYVQDASEQGTIKLRGNSTSLADKPAYNITFNSKQKVFTNANSAKKWSLLANAYEKTMMRNKIAMDLGLALGNVATPEEHYADLYIDGSYKGTYLMSEPAENGRSGIDYDDSDNATDMMFELESERVEDDQTYYTTPRLGVRFVTDDPEGLDTNTARYTNWVNTINNFEDALVNTSSDAVFDLIDVDSFVDMYIVNEFMSTVDFGYSSVKFYLKKDALGNSIIYAGCLWDFDLSSGNSSVAEAREYNKFRGQEVDVWFRYLMQNNTFKQKVIDRYAEEQPVIQNVYKDNALGLSQIHQLYSLIEKSRIRNYSPVSEGGAGWSESEPDSAEWNIYPYSYSTIDPYRYYDYDQHVEYLEDWFKNHNEWMCKQWGIDYDAYDSDYSEAEEPDAPTGVSAYNFYATEKGYLVNFTEVENAAYYNIYMDSSNVLATVSGSGEYVSAGTFSAYADGALHSIYVAAVDSSGAVSQKSSAFKVRVTTQTTSSSDPTDISRIYVVTNSDATITKADKTDASLTIISGDGYVQDASEQGTIKLRGNSTSLADKPAYNITFNSKQKVFTNANSAKKWSLLANAYEKTMMRNKIAMDLGLALGNVATPEEHYADLYIDGSYKGTYLMSEPAENGRSGIDYDDSDDATDMMFELESERVEDDQTYYTTPRLGVRFVTDDPEGLDTNTARYTNWVNTINNFEDALVNTSSDAVFDLIDVDSFVDMYIVNEFMSTVDFGYSSVKFYLKKDALGNSIIYAGCLWDFDLSSGNSSSAEAREYNKFRGQEVNTWFRYLMQNNTFKQKVIDRYAEEQPVIQNVYKDNALGLSQIHQIYNLIEQSRIRNYSPVSEGGAGWSESEPDSAEWTIYAYSYSTIDPYRYYNYDQHVEYLEEWFKNHNEWMCDQWGIDYDAYDSDYVESDDLKITGYQMTSTLNNIEGNMGFRVIYQAEPTVDGQNIEELGLIYGLAYNNDLTAADITIENAEDASNSYVISNAATDAGKLEAQMGDSPTASYYVMTMNVGSSDGSSLSADAYTTTYYVRTYARLADGSLAYSAVESYTVYDVADYIYQHNMVTNKSSYDYLYTKILLVVDPYYKEGDFDWNGTLMKP